MQFNSFVYQLLTNFSLAISLQKIAYLFISRTLFDKNYKFLKHRAFLAKID